MYGMSGFIDHDQIFKGLIEAFFREFMELFCPAEATLIDFTRVEFLREEHFTDVQRGTRRRLDLVAKVGLKEGARSSSWCTASLRPRARSRIFHAGCSGTSASYSCGTTRKSSPLPCLPTMPTGNAPCRIVSSLGWQARSLHSLSTI